MRNTFLFKRLIVNICIAELNISMINMNPVGIIASVRPFITHKAAKAPPRKCDPVSPIKVFAGLVLKNKNPAVMKNSSIKICALNSFIGIKNDITANDIKKLPAAKPSSPSLPSSRKQAELKLSTTNQESPAIILNSP